MFVGLFALLFVPVDVSYQGCEDGWKLYEDTGKCWSLVDKPVPAGTRSAETCKSFNATPALLGNVNDVFAAVELLEAKCDMQPLFPRCPFACVDISDPRRNRYERTPWWSEALEREKFVEFERPLKVGDVIQIRYELPEDGELHIRFRSKTDPENRPLMINVLQQKTTGRISTTSYYHGSAQSASATDSVVGGPKLMLVTVTKEGATFDVGADQRNILRTYHKQVFVTQVSLNDMQGVDLGDMEVKKLDIHVVENAKDAVACMVDGRRLGDKPMQNCAWTISPQYPYIPVFDCNKILNASLTFCTKDTILSDTPPLPPSESSSDLEPTAYTNPEKKTVKYEMPYNEVVLAIGGIASVTALLNVLLYIFF